jgi:hypothetical protein
MRGFAPNDRLTPAPHQTGQAVFPHPAFRVPFIGLAICASALAFRYSVICSFRTLSGVGSPCGPSPRPLPLLSTAKQVVSLRSSMFSPDHHRSGMASSLLPRPPTPAPAATALSVSELAPPVGSSPPEQVYWKIPRRLFRVFLCGLCLNLRGSAAGAFFFEAHSCGSFVLQPEGSTPCLLPTPPRGDAVGTVFGAEPSNCTGGTLTRVDAQLHGRTEFEELLAEAA